MAKWLRRENSLSSAQKRVSDYHSSQGKRAVNSWEDTRAPFHQKPSLTYTSNLRSD